MEKIRLLFRQLDGVTPVDQAPDFQLVRGWTQATVQGPAGILPGSLFGKVPGGDPYLLHVAVSTTLQLGATDLVELQSGPPVQPRRQYQPTPGNTVLLLVRPTDRLRFVIAPQPEIAVELLVESIGGVNELGSRLFGWAEASQGRQNSSATSAVLGGPGVLAAWGGLRHIVHESPNPDVVVLPTRSLVPLDATLTFTKRGTGTPVLAAGAGDTLSGGLPSFAVTRTVIVHNNGQEWAFVGI